MVEVKVRLLSGAEKNYEVDQLMAATKSFPFWVFWDEPRTDNKVKVRFLHKDEVRELVMVGDSDEVDDKKKPTLTVVPFPGGEDNG